MAKNKYPIELKIEVAKAYLDGKGSTYSLAQKYEVGRKSVEVWTKKYCEHGESAFYKKPGNAKYTSEFKMMCVEKVLSGVGNVDDIVAKYNISARSVLLSWISKYNANRELKDYDPKREVYMAEARRKTTIEKAFVKDLKTIYTAADEEAARKQLESVTKKWSEQYPSAMNRWHENWDAISPIFKFSKDVRTAFYTTNAIESLNSCYRRLNKQRIVFPSSQALMKALYLGTFEIAKKWTMPIRNWGKVRGELEIMYPDRMLI